MSRNVKPISVSLLALRVRGYLRRVAKERASEKQLELLRRGPEV